MDKLFVVMPAYNEEENVEMVVREWHEIAAKCGADSRLVIVDDGSRDNTYAKLQKLQSQFPQLQAITKLNGGHGATVLFAYHYAVEHNADYVFQTDSDGQTRPDEFWQFWERRDDYDIQIGYRKDRQDGLSRIIITRILKLVLFFQFGLWITDANTPFRLMSAVSLAELLPKIPRDHNLANVLLTVLYTKGKFRMRYIPITFRPRQGGVNSINVYSIIKIGINAIKDFASLRRSV
jgi:glycosyltransferase involved in cell wall biosynthesis